MKISNSLCINKNQTFFYKTQNPNISFGQEPMEILTTKNGDKYTKIDIFDKPHFFKLNEETKDANILDSMIENIKKTMTGFFIRYDKHEYFIPHILEKSPNIVKHQHIVENGNCVTELNEESKTALNIIESQANGKFDIKELKTIRYLRKPVEGYANNTVEKAFSYFDKLNNDLYLYIPFNNKIQILTNKSFVKNIKLKV